MHAHLTSTRNFISSRTVKLKSLHRRKNSADSSRSKQSRLWAETSSQASSRPASSRNHRAFEREREGPPPQTNSRPQRPSLSRTQTELVPVVNPPSTARPWTQPCNPPYDEDHSDKQFVLNDHPTNASEPRTSEETMKEVRVDIKPFQGLDYPLHLETDKAFIDDDLLKSAFGITMSRAASADGLRKENRQSGVVRLQIPGQTQDGNEAIYEMDVPVQQLRGRSKSDLEISIPLQYPSPARSPNQRPSPSETPRTGASMTSSGWAPTPMTGRAQHPSPSGGPQMSIVSPVENVASPKPRRPFSATSVEGAANAVVPKRKKSPDAAMKSANSMSSSEVSEQMEDGKSLLHSPRSSMSSVNSNVETPRGHHEQERRPSAPDSTYRFDPIGADLYHSTFAPKPSRSASPYLNPPSSRPRMTRQGSATSLQSNFSIANKNKPLPPEPGRLSTISDNNSEQQSTRSRSSSTTLRQPALNKKQTSGAQILPASSVKSINVMRKDSRAPSVSGASLRSKYTPKDLDALDDAFLQRNPPAARNRAPPPSQSQQQGSTIYKSFRSSPNSSQVSFKTDRQYSNVSEEQGRPRRGSRKDSMDPLQISRGPMHMNPSRKPPQPPPTPNRTNSNVAQAQEPPKLAQQRSMSSTHIGAQFQEEQNFKPPQRATTTKAAGSSSKADRILGKTSSSMSPPIRRNTDVDQEREMSDFPPYNTSSNGGPTTNGLSNQESRDEMHGSEQERGSDRTEFDEIRQRLELLSPKDDPSVTFHAFHQSNASRSHDKVPTGQAKSATKSAMSEPSVLREVARNAPRQPEEPVVPTAPTAFIAELEGSQIGFPAEPEPVELPGCGPTPIYELALPSPPARKVFADIPVPPNPTNEAVPLTAEKRRRVQSVNTESGLSAKSRSVRSQRSTRVRSLASLAASEIPELYAHLPSPPNGSVRASKPSMTEEEMESLVTAETAERVLLRILQSLDSLPDVFAAAQVSRGFYRTFKRHELALLKRTLRVMSPAAAELREMSIPYADLLRGATDYTPELYVRHYARDLTVIVELKRLILQNCKSFLRHETISAIATETERSPAIDEAFCRVWTFCLIFGCGKNREDDIVGQMDWLRGGLLANQSTDTRTLVLTDVLAKNSVLYNPPAGFARGNRGGLDIDELYDMTEVWTCLGVLVRGYLGKSEEAREYGVFENSGVLQGDTERENAMLEEWTYHLLTNAPSTILDIASPASPTEETFALAEAKGYTKWPKPTSGISRSTFLKEAVSRVYEEKITLSRPPTSTSRRSFSDLPQAVTPPPPPPPGGSPDPSSDRQRVADHAAEIRARRQQPNYRTMPTTPERPMSNFNDVVTRLEALATSAPTEAPSVPKVPSGLAARFSRRRPKVTVSSPNKSSSRPTTPVVIVDSASSSPIAGYTFNNIGSRISSLREKVTSRANGGKPFQVSSPIAASKERLPTAIEDAIADFVPSSRKGSSVETVTSRGTVSDVSRNDSYPRGGSVVSKQDSISAPRGKQVRDPIDVAVDRLVGMGFDEDAAKKALAKSDSGNMVDVEEATTALLKQRKMAERLERLATMG